jgi:hypothetical protein
MPARTPEARAREQERQNARRRALRVAAKTDEDLAAVLRERDRRADELKKASGTAWARIAVSVSPSELAHLEALAASRGVGVSTLVRDAMMAAGILPATKS